MNDLLENAKRNSKITLEGFFMIFTESEDLGNNAKLFAQDIATLNDTTVYSVGATFIATT